MDDSVLFSTQSAELKTTTASVSMPTTPNAAPVVMMATPIYNVQPVHQATVKQEIQPKTPRFAATVVINAHSLY